MSLQERLEAKKQQAEKKASKKKASAIKKPKRTPRKNTDDAANSNRPDRSGTKMIGGHFDEGIGKQWRMLVAEEGITGQELLEEALNDLFVKKGKKAFL